MVCFFEKFFLKNFIIVLITYFVLMLGFLGVQSPIAHLLTFLTEKKFLNKTVV